MRPLHQRRAWLRRALTIHRNAEALFADMMVEVGPDYMVGGSRDGDNMTDAADDVVSKADDLCSSLERDIRIIKDKRP